MNSYERVMAMLGELQMESEGLNGALDAEKAKQMLLITERIAGALHVAIYMQGFTPVRKIPEKQLPCKGFYEF